MVLKETRTNKHDSNLLTELSKLYDLTKSCKKEECSMCLGWHGMQKHFLILESYYFMGDKAFAKIK